MRGGREGGMGEVGRPLQDMRGEGIQEMTCLLRGFREIRLCRRRGQEYNIAGQCSAKSAGNE